MIAQAIPVTLTATERENMQVHKTAHRFPTVEGKEYWAFRADLIANGMSVPMLVSKDHKRLLDGRHRWRACTEVPSHINPVFVEFQGTPEEEAAEIVRLNFKRRHLTPDQLQELHRELVPQMEQQMKEAAEKNTLSGEKVLPRRRGQPKSVKREAVKQVAAMTGTGQSTVYRNISQAKPRKVRPKKAKVLDGQAFDNEVWRKFALFEDRWPHEQRRRMRRSLVFTLLGCNGVEPVSVTLADGTQRKIAECLP